ncbi:hypothetical protein D3C84_1164890 [compost metagenome]
MRVTHTQLDDEINDLIASARLKLILSGVKEEKANSDEDALIKRAIITYCKSEFTADSGDAARFLHSFESLVTHLSLAGDYNIPAAVNEGDTV